MIRLSMNTHIFLLPIELPDRNCNATEGDGKDMHGLACSVMLRMCKIALALRDHVDQSTEAVDAVTPYRCTFQHCALKTCPHTAFVCQEAQ